MAADLNLVIQLNLPTLPDGVPVFPHLEYAVQQLATAVHTKWLGYAQGDPLPGGGTITPRSGAYLKSIQLRALGPLLHEIWSDAPYAAAIEYGTAAYDLKQILHTSARVRRTKTGKRYLIIPFRWGTGTGSGQGIGFGRNVMTPDQHALAKLLTPSRITGTGWRESGNYPGMQVPQHQYQWGGRLNTRAYPKVFGAGMGKHQQGMVKFQHPTAGGSKHTQYLTFRVMSEDSPGWIRPAIPGKYPLKSALDTARPIAEKAFPAALQKDLAALLSG